MNNTQGDNLHITASIGAGGNVSENSVTLANGTTKTFTPMVGSEVATLTFNGVDVKSQIVANKYTTPAVIATQTLEVTFKKTLYSLSL